MSKKFNTMFSFMGVVNATPDSFSDGGELTDPLALKQRVESWSHVPASFLDLGAESTAPMNAPIGHDAEWARLEAVFSQLKTDLPISLDSFRVETVKKALQAGQKISLWNDVSGQLDTELENILQAYPKLKTVFCHNLAPSRELAGEHMKYISDEDIWQQLDQSFSKALSWYAKRGFNKPKLDFCFGFSKSFDQNWELLKQLPKFIGKFEVTHGKQEWLLAVSRKSFLKKLSLDKVDHDLRKQTEYMQAYYLAWLWQNLAPDTDVLVRLHDPSLAYTFKKIGAIL